MDQEWYILLNGKPEGPFTPLELQKNPFMTPDTLVWKEGFAGWVAARHVPELKEIFKDKPESIPLDERMKPKSAKLPKIDQEQDVLAMQKDPFQFFLWFLTILALVLYIYFQFFYGAGK